MDKIETFIKQISSAKKIGIITHVNPDGDTLGTAMGLKAFIAENFSSDVIVVVNSVVPEIYRWLPGIDEVKHNLDIDKNFEYDLVIAVDVAAKDRLGYSADIFNKAKVTINIDHHVTNDEFAVFNYVDGNASSAGEVLYKMLKQTECSITKNSATCLYTAICADTGNFKYSNTTPDVLKFAGELAALGACPSEISNLIYSSKAKEMVLLTAHCVANSVFLNNNKVAYATVLLEDFQKFNAKNEHTEGIVESLREIKTVEIAILFKAINSEQTKVSLRTKFVDATEIAQKFGGGGHKFAAGCTINKPVKIAVEKLLEELKKYS